MMSEHAPFYRAADVARMLRCSEWWVKEQARRGRIPYSWIGGSYLFTAEHVAEIVQLFEVRPTDEPASAVTPAPRQPGDHEDAAATFLRTHPPRRTRDATSDSAAA